MSRYNNADRHENWSAETFFAMVERLDTELTEAKETVEKLQDSISDLQLRLEESEERATALQATLDSIPST